MPHRGQADEALGRVRIAPGRPAAVAVKPTHDDDPTALWAGARVTELLGDDTAQLPRYGTDEWRRLPSTAPQKAAAVITAAEMWRKYGDEDELLSWFREARRAHPPLASRKTLAELNELARPRAAHVVTAAEGWPPVRIPGRPGWRRHLVDGQQVDLLDNAQKAA